MASVKFNFHNQNVLITGGAQGIGRQMVSDFLKSKAQVTVWDYAEDQLQNLKQEFNTSYLKTQKVDVSQFNECQKAAQSLSQIDIVINNAGVLQDKSLFKMTEQAYLKVIQTNLNGVFYVTKSLLPYFNTNNAFKRIVNISSVVALYGNFGQTNYVAAKAGVLGLTKVWSRELGKKGFTVNAIAPGFIQTEILKNVPDSVMDSLIQKIPLARLGTVKDISNACLFLCSKEAAYINGAVLEVTGGAVP